MLIWELDELARAVEAEIFGGGLPEGVTAVGTDSRSLPPNCLFVALRGERFDGHVFVGDAIRAGARAVMIDREGEAFLGDVGVPRLVVGDTQVALGDWARYTRQREDWSVAAVTGSNGKTTTKELLAAALSSRGPVHRTRGNFNNLVGLPLTVLHCPATATACVLEMGMNAAGEIARLTEIAQPDVGLITNVGPAHLEGLGSLEAVARAKGELFAGLPSDGVAVLNGDDPLIEEICLPLLGKQQRLVFGTGAGAEVRVTHQEPAASGSRIHLSVAGTPVDVVLPLVGAHNALNAAAALAAAWAMGTDYREAAQGMAAVDLPGGRFRSVIGVGGIHLIDDTYNANPASMRAAFSTLAQMGVGRRVAVLGDMLELGERATDLHRLVGAAAAEMGIGWVVAIGEFASAVVEGARRGGIAADTCGSIEEAVDKLRTGLRTGDWVLVKGSRGMRMERVVAELEESAG